MKQSAGGQPDTDRKRSCSSAKGLIVGILLVVLIVLCLLLLTYPRFESRPGQPMAAHSDIAALGVALGNFSEDMGRYPTSAEGLAALSDAPSGIPNWKGPYIERPILNDPWGNPYVYLCPGKHNPDGYDLHSLGLSGKEGAKDNINNSSGP